MRPNYNATKQSFVYFGVYSGQTLDNRKAWVLFLTGARRRERGEIAGSGVGLTRAAKHFRIRAEQIHLFVCFVGQNASKFVIARRAHQHARRARYPLGNGREAWPKT